MLLLFLPGPWFAVKRMVRNPSSKLAARKWPTADLLWVRDGEGFVTLVSGIRHERFPNGWSADEFLDHVHPDDRNAGQAVIRAVQSGARIPETEYRLSIGSEGYRWVTERPLPQPLDKEQRRMQFVSVAFDVTPPKEAAARLHSSEQRFRDLAEVASDWFWEMDAELRFTYFSARGYEVIGIKPDDIIGKTRPEYAGASGEDPEWRRHLDDLANRRPFRAFRFTMQLPNGAIGHFEISGKPFFDEDGAFRGYRGTGTDRTAEVHARQAEERNEKQFRNLVEGSLQGLLIHKDWRIQFANQAVADIFGFDSPAELVELPSLEPLLHPDELDRLRDYKIRRERGEKAPELYQARCVKKDGTLIWAEFRAKPVDWHGVSAIQSAVLDVTEQKKAEEALWLQNEQLQLQNERFTAALENMSQGLCMFDAEKRLVVCNDRYAEMYSLPRELVQPGTSLKEILENRVSEGIYGCDGPQDYIEEMVRFAGNAEASTKIQELTDGRIVAIAHCPMSDGGWVSTHEDTTQLQRVQERIAHMAHHDALTDLPNRILFQQRVEEALSPDATVKSFAVLCLDLNRFKAVNDTLGHALGDELLKAVAERLTGCVRQGDTVARLGGDEFAIVQLSDNQPAAARKLASRISEIIKAPFELDGHQVVIDVSIGIAVASTDGDSPDDLLRSADLALYRAKEDGHGKHHFFEKGMDALLQARRKLELDLRRALEKGEFELHYQPLIDVETNGLCGFEGLIRWRHPERGMVLPGEFIPVAEEIGLIVPIGEWVIKQACAQAVKWPDTTKIAINLSPVQFRNKNLVFTVVTALSRSGLSAERLELEITEAVLLHDTDATLETLRQLKAMGIRIAMDDFGTGYSSLSYLRSFPFDKVKIDRSFVSDLSTLNESSAIVDAVGGLCRSLGMMTTAEGVETREQLDMIREAGYGEMQGYFFSPPLTASEIDARFFDDEAELASKAV